MKIEEIPPLLISIGEEEGATDIATKLVDSDETMIRFSNNEITVTKNWRELEVEFFVMVEKRRAGTTTSLLSAQHLAGLMRRLVQLAKTSPPADVYAPLPSGPFQYDYPVIERREYDPTPSVLVGYVRDAINAALESGAKRVAGSLVASKHKSMVETSRGIHASEAGTTMEISVRAFCSDVASGHSVSISRDEKGFDPAAAGRRAGEIARISTDPDEGVPGRFDALLGPLVFADLISELGEKSSAFLVDTGQSFLADKIGSRVASKDFTLHDDPTVKDSYGLRTFDDEGVPTQRNTLVQGGIFKTYLHNSTTAKKFGVKTTGNAGLLFPSPWNLVVEPGSKRLEEILSSIDRGIYVTNDWYLRYQDYSRGDFSTIPRDGMFLIRNGELEKPLKELRISDNMLRIFTGLAEISVEEQWVKKWEVETPTLVPYALIQDLNFSKSAT